MSDGRSKTLCIRVVWFKCVWGLRGLCHGVGKCLQAAPLCSHYEVVRRILVNPSKHRTNTQKAVVLVQQ